MKNKQTILIFAALVLGIIVGDLCNMWVADADKAQQVAGYFSILTEIFLRMIKMIIAPLIFSTLVAGLAGMDDASAVGRVGGKALGWFLFISSMSLCLGLLFSHLLQPGAGMNLALPAAGASSGLKTTALNLHDFITHVFPKNIVEAMAGNEILQILVFAVFFGLALNHSRGKGAEMLAQSIEGVVPVMLKVTDYVMRFAPLGVFGAVASVITVKGLGVLILYGRFAGSFALTLLVLWMLLVGAGYLVLGRRVFRLLTYIRGPMLVGFSTASSEAAYPRLMKRLEQFGISERLVGFILPLGYSFNLDGSMIYTSFAALFISQAYHVPLTLQQQILMLLVLMVSSKGIAGVPRASLVVVAAVLPMFHLPEAGILVILGIDHFLDMGRTATNVLGNAIATAVIAKWEGGFVTPPVAEAAQDQFQLPAETVDPVSAS
ncbi:aerobic C4-dicarboxylate transport protein [mine drainage metagenome]|uniref:Aerobic C4-dicarboxylate transport protein n=1 Tax=mine drainage metagenome TaxID=410659 RepID=A0A1J5SJU6_9ZZZZ